MNPLQIKLRSFTRRLGVNGVINRLRPKRSYEQNFHEALVDAVKPGDVVWDVGANVGLYTTLFCEWVGKDGHVVAFEPSLESVDQLRQRLQGCPWLRIECSALGESDTKGFLVVSSDSVDNHVVMETEKTDRNVQSIPVNVHRGDTMCERLGKIPNVVKVDVEGFEEEVLAGMGVLLVSPLLRSILVEVHFAKLEMRGRQIAPIRIEELLRESGFKTKWVDPSHIVAER